MRLRLLAGFSPGSELLCLPCVLKLIWVQVVKVDASVCANWKPIPPTSPYVFY